MTNAATIEGVLADLVLDVLDTAPEPVRELNWEFGGRARPASLSHALVDAAFAQGLYVDTQRLGVDIDAHVSVSETWGHERNLEIMAGLLKTADAVGAEELPAIEEDGEAPVLVDWTNPLALSGARIDASPRSLFLEFRDGDDWNERFGRRFLRIPIDAAKRLFADGFAHSLASGGAVAELGGTTTREVEYEVRSVHHGYRVHVTDLYMMSPRVFGAKDSTPVRGRIAVGWHRFGGDKGGAIIWDNGQHLASASNRATRTKRF